MKSASLSWTFRIILLVAITVPLSAQQAPKKQLFQAPIEDLLSGMTVQIGQAMVVSSPAGYDYAVRDNYYALRIERVTLEIADDPDGRRIVLCDVGQDIPCSPNYNVDIAGRIEAWMLQGAENGPITPQEFRLALTGGNLLVLFNDGDLGVGRFSRID